MSEARESGKSADLGINHASQSGDVAAGIGSTVETTRGGASTRIPTNTTTGADIHIDTGTEKAVDTDTDVDVNADAEMKVAHANTNADDPAPNGTDKEKQNMDISESLHVDVKQKGQISLQKSEAEADGGDGHDGDGKREGNMDMSMDIDVDVGGDRDGGGDGGGTQDSSSSNHAEATSSEMATSLSTSTSTLPKPLHKDSSNLDRSVATIGGGAQSQPQPPSQPLSVSTSMPVSASVSASASKVGDDANVNVNVNVNVNASNSNASVDVKKDELKGTSNSNSNSTSTSASASATSCAPSAFATKPKPKALPMLTPPKQEETKPNATSTSTSAAVVSAVSASTSTSTSVHANLASTSASASDSGRVNANEAVAKPLSSSMKKQEEPLPPNPLLDQKPKEHPARVSVSVSIGDKNSQGQAKAKANVQGKGQGLRQGQVQGKDQGLRQGLPTSSSSKNPTPPESSKTQPESSKTQPKSTSTSTPTLPSASKSTTPTKAPHTSGRGRKAPKTQLEEMYPPFILPTDKSVDDARNRLKTAIGQTRILREAFTERLYEKYRVVLRPVPTSDEAVIHALTTQPKMMYQQLMQQIGVIQAEKDVEKKIAQQINAQLAAANNSAETAAILGGLTGIDNAEQLGWFGAGLNLVILPEEDVNEAELAARGINERSPIDPETGQKVKDLSSAAAVAASAMLDRVRKGAEMRRNRIRKQQAGAFGSNVFSDTAGFLPSPGTSFLSSPGMKPYTSYSSSLSSSTRPQRTDPQSSSAGGKFNKGKITGSSSSLLSLSADAEGLRPNRKLSAAAYALLNSNLKKMAENSSDGAAYQPYPRHPFPQSKGARSISYGQIQGHSLQHPFSLPSVAIANDRRKLILAKSSGEAIPRRTGVDDALKSVVDQFVDVDNSNQVEKGQGPLAASTNQTKNPRLRLKRKVSEIGVLHHDREKRFKSFSTSSTSTSTSTTTSENNDTRSAPGQNTKNEIDPLLIISVMQSLGLIQRSSSSRADDSLSDESLTIDATLSKRIHQKGKDTADDAHAKGGPTKADDFPLPSNLTKRTVLSTVLNTLSGNVMEKNLDPIEKKGIILDDSKPTTTLPESVDGVEQMDVSTDENTANKLSQTAVESKSQPLGASSIESSVVNTPAAAPAYIPSLRGGGEDTDDENIAFDIASPGSKSSAPRPPDGTHTVSSNVQQNSDLANVHSIWNEQHSHQGLGSLQPQDSASAISQQQAYAMMAAGMRSADPVTSGIYSPVQQQNGGLAAAMNIGPLQTVQHHQNLQHSLNGDQFRRQSFQSVNNHQMHLAQNQLQQAAAALQSGAALPSGATLPSGTTLQSGHTILRPGSSDMNDYFSSMHPVSISQAYSHANPEWAALAAQHGLLSPHPSTPIDPASLGLTPHQAAMLFRDRTTQVLLREQQQLQAAQVAAAQHSAIAMSQAAFLNTNSNSNTTTNSSSFSPRPQTSEPSSIHSRKSRPSSSSSRSARSIGMGTSNSLQSATKKDAISSGNSKSASNKSSALPRPSSAPAPNSKIPTKVSGTEKYKLPSNYKGPKSTKSSPSKKSNSSKSQTKRKPSGSASVSQIKHTPSQPHGVKKSPQMTANRNGKIVSEKNLNKKESSTINHISNPPSANLKPSKPPPSMKPPSKPIRADADASASAKSKDLPKKDIAKPLGNVGNKMANPPRPSVVNDDKTKLISEGYFHEIKGDINIDRTVDGDAKSSRDAKSKKDERLLGYLLKAGAAVPIPKPFLLTLLKTRLNTPFFKSTVTTLSTNTGTLMDPCDVIAAVITTWLWANHRDTFEAALAKGANITSDPQCKWLVKAAIEKATNENVAKGMERLVMNTAIANQNSAESTPTSVKIKVASIVSESLNSGLSLNVEANAVLPNFDVLVDYLDELRIRALRTRCQERVLLADLISRHTRMSEAFSNAYTSSTIRACEALGYDEVGEIVQNEATKSSSQMPFDILSDASGAWEDPCRPLSGYSPGSSGDELMKRAHARAMIQRSLKKLQDRHNIKGGTATAGVYSDSINSQGSKGISSPPPPRPSPRGSGNKRRSSSSGMDGIRANSAAAAALFAPNHISVPFLWDPDDTENNPYGRHVEIKSGRHRSPSNISRSGPFAAKRLKSAESRDEVNKSQKITTALEWSSVADLFQNVTAVEKPNRSNNDHDDHNVAVPLGSTIFAPFCRKIEEPLTLSDGEDEDSISSSDEENLDDDHILDAHQRVLNTIKDKFDTMMRIRQEYQERSRRASFGR